MDSAKDRITARPQDVIPSLAIFLTINFFVAAIYFHIINP